MKNEQMPRSGVERFALAGMVAYPSVIEESGVLPEHFSDRRVAQAAAALPNCKLRGAKGEINFLELCRIVGEDHSAFQKYLGAWVSDIDQARMFCRELLDLATADLFAEEMRRALSTPPSVGESATDGMRARAEMVLASFARRTDQEEEFLVDGQRAYVEQLREELQTGKRMGLLTGLKIVDEWMGGLNCGELTVVVAAGGVGKSTLAMDLARRVGRDGSLVLYWSAEMSRRQVYQRDTHGLLGVPIRGITLSERELDESLRLMEREGYGDRIAFRYSSAVTATQILSAARKFQLRHGNLGMVVLDHLGCYNSEHPRASMQEQIEMAMGQLVDLTKALNVPFILVTHLNRAGQIRGSQRILDVSDNVIELRRDDDGQYTEARLLKARQTGETHRAMKLSYSVRGQTFNEVSECAITPQQKEWSK